MKKRGFTLIELLVVIAIIAMLLAILMPALNKVKKIAQRVVCGTNLKGLGNAMTVYANDFRGQYPCHGQGGPHTWDDRTDGWQNPVADWTSARRITVGSSLYLLVRLADVGTKSFVCPASDQKEFSGRNQSNLDFVELWDFGTVEAGGSGNQTWDAEGPARCVSYSYHQPYAVTSGTSTGSPGRFRADDTRSAAFALMADKNPWYDPKLPNAGGPGTYTPTMINEWVNPIFDYWNTSSKPTQGSIRQAIMVANAQPHEREGQNVMYVDGHNNFEKTTDVGVKNDNIYTVIDPQNTDPLGWRRGRRTEKPSRNQETESPKTQDDSFLVNDFVGTSVR